MLVVNVNAAKTTQTFHLTAALERWFQIQAKISSGNLCSRKEMGKGTGSCG